MCSLCKEQETNQTCPKCHRLICYANDPFGGMASRAHITLDNLVLCDHCGMKHDTGGKTAKEMRLEPVPWPTPSYRHRGGRVSPAGTLHGYGKTMSQIQADKAEKLDIETGLMSIDGKRPLSMAEVARRMNVGTRRVSQLVRAGELTGTRQTVRLPSTGRCTSRYAFLESDVDALIERRKDNVNNRHAKTEKLLTVNDVAERLEVNPRRVRTLIERGELIATMQNRPTKRYKKRYVIRETDLRAYIAKPKKVGSGRPEKTYSGPYRE